MFFDPVGQSWYSTEAYFILCLSARISLKKSVAAGATVFGSGRAAPPADAFCGAAVKKDGAV